MPPFRLAPPDGGRSIPLPPGRTLVVGRGEASDIPLYDPTVSRAHAELTAEADAVWVRDLGSSNGTCINGARITTGRLLPGDAISFGKLAFRLEVAWGPDSPPAVAALAAGGEIVREVAVSGGSGGILPALPGTGPGRAVGRPADGSDAERVARRLAVLLDVAQKLSGELDLDRLLRTVVDTTFEVMNVDRVSILLRDEATGELTPVIARSRFGDTQPQPVPRSIAEKVMAERVAVVSQNTATDTRFRGKSILLQHVRSAMCSPLMASGDQVLGLLYVDNLTTANSFSDEDLQFLVAFSGLAAVAIKTSRYAERSRREALVRSNFERYFAPNVASEIAQHGEAVRPGGDRRPVTVLFSDIRGFTPIAEALGPDAIAGLLTEYFTVMVDIVFEHGGTLDKFIGDAIMALWGAPIAVLDDADRAVHAALVMQDAVAALNQRWAQAGRPGIGVGIGVNYGEVFAGNIGSHRRLEYTVIGDAVNVAARLCSEAGPGEILVTEAVCARVRRPVEFDFLPEIGLRGKARSVRVFRVRR